MNLFFLFDMSFLQARLELATSAFLFNIVSEHFKLLSYKYHALTNCATGDDILHRLVLKNSFHIRCEFNSSLFH